MDEKENNQSSGISPGSSGGSSAGDYSLCSSPDVDVVACTPQPQTINDDEQKRYFCQRCLNHKQRHPRKGHKPFCQFAHCECSDCRMVEERRRLNNMLSVRRLDPNHTPTRTANGKKIRDPKCALCSAHGNKQPLRGHKKAQCPFLKCGCHLCGLIENRRTLMARQIKLRRDQQKQRKAQLSAAAGNAKLKEISPSEQETTEQCTEAASSPNKIQEPLRVPPLMPLIPRPQVQAQPTPPLLLQPTALLPTSPMFMPPVERLDLRPVHFDYRLMNPLAFQIPSPFFPYVVPTIPFLVTPQ